MSPENENAVLAQQEIDAMMASSSEIGGQTPAPAQPPAAQPSADAAATTPAEAPAPAAPPDGATPADLAQRLARLEAAVARISQDGSGSGQLAANVQALAQQLQALSARVDEILQHLPNTLGYGLRSTFQCSSCGTQGLIAARVICTQCNTDTFAGWWPQT